MSHESDASDVYIAAHENSITIAAFVIKSKLGLKVVLCMP